MFYSKSTGGFYESVMHGPTDVVEVTTQAYLALLAGQASGKVIVPDGQGYPILQDPPLPTEEQLATIERQWRNNALLLADIGLNKVQDGMGFGTVTQWREYRCALRNWPENEFFPDSTKRPVAPDAQ